MWQLFLMCGLGGMNFAVMLDKDVSRWVRMLNGLAFGLIVSGIIMRFV